MWYADFSSERHFSIIDFLLLVTPKRAVNMGAGFLSMKNSTSHNFSLLSKSDPQGYQIDIGFKDEPVILTGNHASMSIHNPNITSTTRQKLQSLHRDERGHGLFTSGSDDSQANVWYGVDGVEGAEIHINTTWWDINVETIDLPSTENKLYNVGFEHNEDASFEIGEDSDGRFEFIVIKREE
jgi:hypothetical protein